MSGEIMRQIPDTIQAEVRARPSGIEFEMAYQVRIAVERIRFAIRHLEHSCASEAFLAESRIRISNGYGSADTGSHE